MSSIQAQNVNHPDHRENLNAEKYAIIREAILTILPSGNEDESMAFSDLEAEVHTFLEDNDVSADLFPKAGSVRWYTKAVQLDLEARNEIERVPKQSPIRLRRVPN